jgi:serine phosphatase RsbU (regulator of sigma subunit)
MRFVAALGPPVGDVMSAAVTPVPEITVSRAGRSWSVPLAPGTVAIGRAGSCGVCLDDPMVSRQHARLYQDPFRRWIVEDLGSHNGTWVGGQRVKSGTVTPGERIRIGPFTLKLTVVLDQRIPADETVSTTVSLVEAPSDEDLIQKPHEDQEALSKKRLMDLDRMGECLAGVVGSRDLYPEVCRWLGERFETAVLVLRVPRSTGVPPGTPALLACEGGAAVEGAGPRAPYRLSQRTIRAAVESGQAIVAGNVRLSDEQLGLTVVDGERPRTVLCAPVGSGGDWADLLYLEVSAEQAEGDALAFIRVAARQVGLVGQSILRTEDVAKRHALDQQLAMAREIQANLVPRSLDIAPGLDLALAYEPALWVGGDYCDIWPLADGRVAFAVGDVSGKGFPAALVMANLQAALRAAVNSRPDPAEAVSQVGRHMAAHLPGGMFVTLFMGLLDPATGRLTYLNAGHILPLLVRGSGEVLELGQPANLPLGLSSEAFLYDEAVLEIGTALVAVTDGVTDAMSTNGDRFGCERLMGLVKGTPFTASQDLVGAITRGVREFCRDEPQQDDITVLGVLRRKPA